MFHEDTRQHRARAVKASAERKSAHKAGVARSGTEACVSVFSSGVSAFPRHGRGARGLALGAGQVHDHARAAADLAFQADEPAAFFDELPHATEPETGSAPRR